MQSLLYDLTIIAQCAWVAIVETAATTAAAAAAAAVVARCSHAASIRTENGHKPQY